MRWLRQLFREWIAKRNNTWHRNGYDWAAGKLLRDQMPEVVEAQLPTDVSDSFDRGVNDALRAWYALQPPKP